MAFSENITNLLSANDTCLSVQELTSYAKGILSSEAEYKIELHLIDCPFCSDALEGVETLNSPDHFVALHEKCNEKIDESLTDAPNEPKTDDTPVIPFMKRYGRYLMAASVAALLAIAGWEFLPGTTNYQTSNEAMAQIYEKPFDPVVDVAGDSGENVLMDIRAAFLAQDYNSVLDLEGDIGTDDPNKVPARFYFAQAQLQTGQFDAAEASLKQILESGEIDYADHAEWLLGQVYLTRGNDQKAVELFTRISHTEGHYYQNEAQKALEIFQ